MAIQKIQIIPEGTDNYGTILHPETSADNIIGQGIFGTATGTNNYAVTMLTVLELIPGTRVTVKFTNANTDASTLNVSNLGAKSIRKANGATLTAGNIKAGGVYTLVYDGVNFILQGEGGEYGTATAADVLAGKTIGTESGIITGTMVNRGNVTNTLTTQGGQYTIPQGYHDGAGKVTASFTNLVAGNIKQGVKIGGVTGTLVAVSQANIIRSGYPVTFKNVAFKSGTTPAYTITIPELNNKNIINIALVNIKTIYSGSSTGNSAIHYASKIGDTISTTGTGYMIANDHYAYASFTLYPNGDLTMTTSYNGNSYNLDVTMSVQIVHIT